MRKGNCVKLTASLPSSPLSYFNFSKLYSEKNTVTQKIILASHCDLLSKFVNYLLNAIFSEVPLQLICHLGLNSGVAPVSKYHRHWFKPRFRVKFQFDVDANL